MSNRTRQLDEEIAPELVPIALIAVEVGESVDAIAHRFREVVVPDDIGLRSIPVDVARRFFAEREEQAALMQQRRAEQMRLLKEREAKQPKYRGVVAPIGAPLDSAAAVLMSHDRKLE